jgi:hypothetical protein
MRYKKTFFFICKCLTINHVEKNKILVEDNLKSGNIDWETVVKVSTAHLVFPALYCNLKRANFLPYLPTDLVEYMKHITDLNRERNEQIIVQAKEINELLIANNITPIFLKGTGNLIEGLYEDIAERMVGDIDLLINIAQLHKADKILRDNKYASNSILYDDHRHLPRLTHPKKIAAVEIHRTMLDRNKSSHFNYKTVKQSLIFVNDCSLLSIENQIKLTVFSKLINDSAYQLKSISLRVAYDLFCLFYKQKVNTSILEESKNQKELNAGLMLYASILNKPKKMFFINTKNSKIYFDKAIKQIEGTPTHRLHLKYLFIVLRFKISIKALYKKSYFNFICSRLVDKQWYNRRFGI